MAARARGIPENKVLFGHTLRTAAPPLITCQFCLCLRRLGEQSFSKVFFLARVGESILDSGSAK